MSAPMMSAAKAPDHPHLQEALLGFTRTLAPIRDRQRLATVAAAELHRLLAGTLVCVTPLVEDSLVVGASHGSRRANLKGLRLARGTGVGGRAAATGAVVAVDDYAREIDCSDLVEVMAGTEGIRGAAAAPLRCDGRLLGIVFAGHRRPGAPGDRELHLLSEVADDLGRMLGAAEQTQREIERARTEERRRLAAELHDEVAPLLFGIATAGELQRARALAAEAGSAVRAAIGDLTAPAERALPVALAATVERIRARTGLAAELVDLGVQREVTPDVIALLCRTVAEALTNVSKHAPGASAVVTLFGDVEVTVQDDGPGLRGGSGFGLAALRERLVPFDGALHVGGNEDGGVTVTVRVPLR